MAADIDFGTKSNGDIAYLPVAGQSPPGDCHIAGWGIMDNRTNSDTAKKLQFADIAIYTDDICAFLYPLSFNRYNMFCAGDFISERDACEGDSGGPLICDINGKPVIYGVVSFGKPCSSNDSVHIGVYAKVFSAITWINSFNVNASFISEPTTTTAISTTENTSTTKSATPVPTTTTLFLFCTILVISFQFVNFLLLYFIL